MSLPIEDYALIGDLHTAALVGKNGSIDWLCLPDFDSPSCFSKLLGDDSHGFWQLAPAGGEAAIVASRRRYRENSLVLETDFDTATGTVRITDCMPMRATHPHVVRQVEGIKGTVDMHMNLTLRFGYGEVLPWVTASEGLIRMTAGPDGVALWHMVEPRGEDMHTVADFTVREGQRYPFTLVWYPSEEEPPPPLGAYYAVRLTDTFWQQWASRCTYQGPWREAVVRSLITLKALIYDRTGGIVAAATTSLPETLGGNRNWDYRYCWLRDATLTLESLMRGGYHEEAMAWRDWLLRAVAGDVSKLQIMYGPAGERRLEEWEADWLPGYEGSAPVRIGNAASGQFQLDVYGEVISALYASTRAEGVHSQASWALQTQLIEFIATAWTKPDDGIWEVRGPQRHFTHSKVMAWVAVDRAVRSLEEWPELDGPVERWRALREEIFNEVCAKGYNEKVGAFTQYYGGDKLDASVLLIPHVGFLPADDPRVVSTVEAIERGLVQDGFVLRYIRDQQGAVDGLSTTEGAFLACSFWLVDCLHLMGRTDDAQALFERLLAVRNDLGLLSEEYDPHEHRLLGNFPQAFSHISIVNSASCLSGHDPLTAGPDEETPGAMVDESGVVVKPSARFRRVRATRTSSRSRGRRH